MLSVFFYVFPLSRFFPSLGVEEAYERRPYGARVEMQPKQSKWSESSIWREGTVGLLVWESLGIQGQKRTAETKRHMEL